MEEEISFLEKSCEKLRRELERYSTPLDKRAQARDSGVATMVGASGGQRLLQSSPTADDTVILQGHEGSGRAIVESTDKTHVTMRPTKPRKIAYRNEAESTDTLHDYSVHDNEHRSMLNAQLTAHSPSIASAPTFASAPMIASAPSIASAPIFANAPLIASAPANAPIFANAPTIANAPIFTSEPLIASAPSNASAPLFGSAPLVTSVPSMASAPIFPRTPLIASSQSNVPSISNAPIISSAPLITSAPIDYNAPLLSAPHTIQGNAQAPRLDHLLNGRPQIDGRDQTDRSSKCNIKPATFDGSHSWLDYKSHFDACAAINNWSEKEKGLYLAVSLRGTAQGVLGNVSSETGHRYDLLVKALEERFAPPNQTELYRAQLKERKQRASETLSELGQAIRRLTCLAYPTAPSEVRETLGKDAFIDALVNSDMRLRIKQSRPGSLNDAIRLSVELDAYYKTERRGELRLVESTEHDDVKSAQPLELIDLMTKMQSQLDKLEKQVQSQNWRPREHTLQARDKKTSDGVICYYCKEKGHIRRNCPKLRNKDTNKNRNSPSKKSDSGSARRIRSKRRRNQRMQGHVGGSTVSNEAGIFIEAEVNGTRTKLLIDTGASLTLVSKKLHDMIAQENRPELSDSAQKVFNASGNALTHYGKAEFQIKIGQFETIIPAMVTDITVEGILGLDFLRKEMAL